MQILSHICIPGREGPRSGRALWGINRRQKDEGSPSLEKACADVTGVMKLKGGTEGFCSYGSSLWAGPNSQEVKTSKVFMKRSCCCS